MENCLEFPGAIQYSLLKKIRLPIIMDFMKPENNDMILDLGSGGGYFSKILAKKTKSVISFDISPTNARNAKQSIDDNNISFVIGDAAYLPFKKGVFDKILATEIIEHIENDNLFIKECDRVLKNVGHIVITTPCTNPAFPLDWLRRLSGVNIEEDFGHVRGGYTKQELEKLMNEQNLIMTRVGYFSQFFTQLCTIIIYFGKKFKSGRKNWTHGDTQKDFAGTKSFKLYKLVFPIFYQFSNLDKLLYKFKGHHIIIKISKFYR